MLEFETPGERESFASIWGDVMVAPGGEVPGQYVEPQAEDLLMEGTAPTFLSSAAEFAAASVTIGTAITAVRTHYGETRGPFAVVRWQVQDDGAFVVVSLNQT